MSMFGEHSLNGKGGSVRRRLLFTMGMVVLAAGLIGSMTSAGAASGHRALPTGRTGVKGLPQFNAKGTVPSNLKPGTTPRGPRTPGAPGVGVSWAGISDGSVAPPDPNGAIGPLSYIEIINLQIAIYTRAGGLTASATLATLTGHSQFSLSDPMVLWDADTQRFYYNVWDVTQATMAWGFSKNNNPTSIPSSFCNYTASFGYNPSVDIPDYPKLGQTKNFLLIGVNHYPSFTSLHADRSDVLWITKPQGSDPITTCPSTTTFKSGKFTNVRNEDGTQAWTPVPAIQIDPSKNGFVVTSSDVECPDLCGTGNLITVHAVRPNPTDPTKPQLLVTGHSITVPSFVGPNQSTFGAPQKNTTKQLNVLDGRLEHAVSAIDPTNGKVVVWTGHAVMKGTTSTEFRWYEILPTPIPTPSLVQSGVVSDPSLFVFNGAASPDRACTLTICAHGDSVVIGFTTSSSTTFPAVQMVSKIGAGAQSAFVTVHTATTFDNDFTCNPICRWGDYGGATPDPTKTSGTHGEVWLTQDTTNGTNTTWNWEALP